MAATGRRVPAPSDSHRSVPDRSGDKGGAGRGPGPPYKYELSTEIFKIQINFKKYTLFPLTFKKIHFLRPWFQASSDLSTHIMFRMALRSTYSTARPLLVRNVPRSRAQPALRGAETREVSSTGGGAVGRIPHVQDTWSHDWPLTRRRLRGRFLCAWPFGEAG